MKRMNVTCAVILNGNQVLACQRGKDSDHPFEWELPGGKVELNETEEQCIVREIKEELCVEIEVLKPLKSVDFDYPNKKIRLIPFLCKIKKGTVKLSEHVACKWQLLDCWAHLKWSAADVEILSINKSLIG